jgi:hypothetical protein
VFTLDQIYLSLCYICNPSLVKQLSPSALLNQVPGNRFASPSSISPTVSQQSPE